MYLLTPQKAHLWCSGCVQHQIRQLLEQFVEGVLHVAVGQHRPTQVGQQRGGELPLAGLGLQGQRHGQRRNLAPHGTQVQSGKQLLEGERDVSKAGASRLC